MNARALVVALPVLVACPEYDLIAEDPGPVEAGFAVLHVDPSLIDFGEVPVDETAQAIVTVSNVGESRLQLAQPLLVEGLGAFALTPLDDGELDAGESADFGVTFTPVAPGFDENTILVQSDATLDPDAEVLLQGSAPEPSEYEIDVMLTVDDAWTAWIDGVEFGGSNQQLWSRYDVLETTLLSGDHVISVHGRDVSAVISGLISVVRVNGAAEYLSGDGTWLMMDEDPGAGWQDVGFDSTAWLPAISCEAQETWGTYWPADFYDAGAEWVWWTSNCRDLRSAWFRLEFTLD